MKSRIRILSITAPDPTSIYCRDLLILLLLPLHGTVLIIDGDVFNRLALSEAALLGQNRGTVTRARQQRRSFSAFQSAKGLCALIYTNQPLSGSPFQRSFDQEEGWMPIIRRDLRSLWSLGCDAGRNRQRESTYRFGSGRRQASEQGCTARQAPLPGTVPRGDGDVFNSVALSEPARLGQDSLFGDKNKAAAALFFRFSICHLPACPGGKAVCAQHWALLLRGWPYSADTLEARFPRYTAVPHGTTQRDAGSVYHWHLQPLRAAMGCMPSTEEGCPPPSSSTWHSTAHRRRRFNRLALSEAALPGQDSLYNDQNKAAAAFIFRLAVCHSSCPSWRRGSLCTAFRTLLRGG